MLQVAAVKNGGRRTNGKTRRSNHSACPAPAHRQPETIKRKKCPLSYPHVSCSPQTYVTSRTSRTAAQRGGYTKMKKKGTPKHNLAHVLSGFDLIRPLTRPKTARQRSGWKDQKEEKRIRTESSVAGTPL